MGGIITATVCVAAVGLFVGLFLGVAGKKFAVEVDERENLILDVLPGANCGGCGQAGCAAMAHAIVTGAAPVNGCPVGGEGVAKKVAGIMGQEISEEEPMTAFVKCSGTCEKAKDKLKYSGQMDCKFLDMTPGKGPKACAFGCLGGGTCVRVCQFDAIHIVDGIAKVDPDKCKACGQCVANCPRHMIEMKPKKSKFAVSCSSKDKGPAVMKVCAAGCIGCGLCEKNCPKDAIHVVDNIAHIDYSKCVSCGICAQKCPKKVIEKLA
ncbi:MAG: RnfABCDGE type electron transport complex subunit B [Lachnospiraceae bacterium]|nr:RnfABCDGE type electron transport complex subunit B [Lachnospiraceae bacterium]